MLDKVRTILAATSAVTDEVPAASIFYEAPAQGQNMPYIVLTSQGGTPHDSKDKVSELDEVPIEVHVYAKALYTDGSYTGAYNIADIIRTTLDHYSGTVLGNVIFIRATSTINTLDFSVSNKPMKSASIDFDVWVSR